MKDINIEDLTFAYSNKIEVLHHISLVVESGESVGLIGANGAGKSTLLKLLYLSRQILYRVSPSCTT